jgi:plasmid stability protein
MQNLTVRVPDEVYRTARIFAARHQTSISNVVADFLFTLRNLATFPEPIPPGAAVNLHISQLRDSDIGRVNLEPFNDKEWSAVAKRIVKELESLARTETVQGCTNQE